MTNMRKRKHVIGVAAATIAIILAIAATSASAAVFYVGGGGPPCDFDSIQDAVDAAGSASWPDPDEIRLAYDENWFAESVLIGEQHLTISGGYANCQAMADGHFEVDRFTRVGGNGGAAAPVFMVRGGGVRVFRNLIISGGDNPDGNGGGIDYQGTGAVEVVNTYVGNNVARNGGGIYVRDLGGSAVLEIKSNAIIHDNQAFGNGGGIHAEGAVRLYMVEPGAWILNNTAADGSGGGLLINGAVFATIESPGRGGAALFEGNLARDGGAIGVIGRAGHLDVMGTHGPPVRLSGNTATERGGVLFVEDATNISPAVAHFDNFVLDHNRARHGAAVHDSGRGSLTLGYHHDGNRSIRCTSSDSCNLIEGNETTGDVEGAVLYKKWSLLRAGGFRAQRNVAVNLVMGDDAAVKLGECLMADNDSDVALVRAVSTYGGVTIDHCTFARNRMNGGTALFAIDSVPFSLQRSVVELEPGQVPLDHPGSPNDLQSVSSSYNIGIAPGEISIADLTSVDAAPRFVDPAFDDYRPRPGSAAVDFAPSRAEGERDLLGNLRPVEQSLKADAQTPDDAGAYELPEFVNLVMNHAFSGDLRAWERVEGDPVVEAVRDAYDSDRSYGDPGKGSLRILAPAGSGRSEVTGARQCIHLPAAGHYGLGGQAFTAGGLADLEDVPVIEWRYHRETETCDGPGDGRGEMHFLSSAGTWRVPTTVPVISTSQFGDWTPNSAIELRLVVRKHPEQADSHNIYALFDELRLYSTDAPPPRPDFIFRDGLEFQEVLAR